MRCSSYRFASPDAAIKRNREPPVPTDNTLEEAAAEIELLVESWRSRLTELAPEVARGLTGDTTQDGASYR